MVITSKIGDSSLPCKYKRQRRVENKRIVSKCEVDQREFRNLTGGHGTGESTLNNT